MTAPKSTQKLPRRKFLTTTAAATAAFTIVRPSAVRGSDANSKIEIALLGCGGRGTWITDLFNKHGGYKWVACADYYQDHADKVGEKLNIPKDRRFTTLSAYQQLLGEKFDAVVIETPPYFHPMHAAAAVDAGKHVYVAKPIAVDVPGCASIAESGKKATEKKQVFLVDFQTRANTFYREAVKRVHHGDIGSLVSGWALYPYAGGRFPAPATPDDRLRCWYCYRELSGDFIIEQNIHTLDVATWILDADPIKAAGTGGSKGLRAYGNIWDHFNVNFWFPKDVILTYMGNQCTPGTSREIPCRVYGTKGMIDTDYYTHARIEGSEACRYDGGKWKDLYTDGTVVNVKEFHDAVTTGDVRNLTVAPSVRSNLTCILGRNAAYKGEPLTWSEMMKANEKYEPDLSGLKA